jgi:hypothetical protein
MGRVLGDDNGFGSQFDLLQRSLAALRRDNSVRRIDGANAQPMGEPQVNRKKR